MCRRCSPFIDQDTPCLQQRRPYTRLHTRTLSSECRTNAAHKMKVTDLLNHDFYHQSRTLGLNMAVGAIFPRRHYTVRHTDNDAPLCLLE